MGSNPTRSTKIKKDELRFVFFDLFKTEGLGMESIRSANCMASWPVRVWHQPKAVFFVFGLDSIPPCGGFHALAPRAIPYTALAVIVSLLGGFLFCRADVGSTHFAHSAKGSITPPEDRGARSPGAERG